MMFPEGFVQRIKSQEYIDSSGLLNALQEPSPVSIRINPSKWNKKPLNSDPVPWCETGYYLEQRPSYTLDPLFHSGCYYPQEASGMFMEQAFKKAINTNEYIKVLDLCAAPGGKSTHLSSLIGPGGLLVANEVIKTRTAVLAENITKWGYSNTIVTQNDPSAFSELTGFFDVILVDAPCSGEGMFRDRIAVNEWSEENANHCSERQKRILSDVWPAIRNNGILIYSTCTFNPGENESNIKWLTSKYSAETIELKTSDFKNITEINHQGIKCYGFYPGRVKGEGFFISVIRKTGNSGNVKVRSRRKYVNELKRPDLEIAKEWTAFPYENIAKAGEDIFSFPGKTEDFSNLMDCLKIIKKGTKICTAKKNDYIPAHELALSDSLRRDIFPVAELDYGQAVAYLRRDNFLPESTPKGWFIATYKGTNLGFCKNIGSRINNYFPVECRIRMNVPETAGSNIINWSTN
jgi:16S rRNA C967 or C1407 C5-methylase (RsmB/RsmF family)/NOL1/NOP2/fmu family ribosome biogenesis protein